ncbi:MAG TPA: fatty acid desaturase [Gemmatimonadales bacterium]|nr:fatty acid desaturase [Gemmatimonadales bacterium]
MNTSALYASLRDIKLTTVRHAISSACYARSVVQTFGWFAFDLALYVAMMWGVLASDSAWAKLAFGVGAGVAVSIMFVWAHDAAHGALFRSDRTAEILGTALMLPSLNPYRLWCHGHNRVHHGFTSYSPIDWIWRPLTPAAYRAKGRWGRLVYRLERTPWGCALHYLVRVWWPGMVMFRPDPRSRERAGFAVSKLVTLGFALVLAVACWRLGGGLIGLVAGMLVPFLVFNHFIALFIFLHHTHPDVPFFDHRPEWSNTIGQVYCSIVVRCSRLSELLVHNILIHVPHHVDPRIPFYRLKRAYADLQSQYAPYLHEYRFRWSTVWMIFRRCKLYDFERHTWYTFREALRPRPS